MLHSLPASHARQAAITQDGNFCSEGVIYKLTSGHSRWHRAACATCLLPLVLLGLTEEREEVALQRQGSSRSLWQLKCEAGHLKMAQGRVRAGSCPEADFSPAPASTREYMGWLLLQGMCCFHPDKIAAPIPIPAVAGKESISICSSLLLFLSAILFPSTPSYLSSLHWNFCPLQPSCPLFHFLPPNPSADSATALPPPATPNFALKDYCKL